MSDSENRIEQCLADSVAASIHSAFHTFQREFYAITRRARRRFESCDWHGNQSDAVERLDLYPHLMDPMIAKLREELGDHASSESLWKRIKPAYMALIDAERNEELATTFFNSVTRKIFSTVGVNPAIEFLSLDSAVPSGQPGPGIYNRYRSSGDTVELLRRILRDYRFRVDYANLDADAERAAGEVERHLESTLGSRDIDAVDTCKPVYYRDNLAYIVGRIVSGRHIVPLVLPLRNRGSEIDLDAVLMTENEVSVLFSFTRAYFHVEAECPREQIVFLKTIMPLKPVAELYTALGFNKHGKTELYRSLRRHLERSSGRFEVAEGDRGMVMLVFALPFYDVVFKVIRDRFAYPKQTTRRGVLERYRLVFKHDRVGRLVDAQEFEHLTFAKRLFSEDLLEELLAEAGQTVAVDGDDVVIRHLYTERKMTPLNVYLRRAAPPRARRVVIDYGHAIKELAAANIFPGDFLLKNFGVTRHGRVVFYDYDELCLLTDCRFRRMPPPRNLEDEMAAEPWFTVGPDDIFPEEFSKFLGLSDGMRELFVRYHGDLFTVEFWAGLQERHRAGEILEFFPYPQDRRLHRV